MGKDSNTSTLPDTDLPASGARVARVIPGLEGGEDSWGGFNPVETSSDVARESSYPGIRPETFSDYVGQESVKENLRIACAAAQRRSEALDHVLLHGPPGLGKTSLARILAHQLGVGLKSTSGPVIERPGDLAAILTSLAPRDVLFIDEIHRLPRIVEEVLYPALEDYQIDILIGQGPAARSVKINLKPFTLVGATTRTGLLTSPLRDRFGMVLRLEYYNPQQLQSILLRGAKILGVEIEPDASMELAKRARGTPRIAHRILRRVRDFAQEQGDVLITLHHVRGALELLKIDSFGLDAMDRRILQVIIDSFHGGPVGVETIAAAIGEESQTIEDVYEPFLVQEGFLARTRRGREVTDRSYQLLGRPAPRRQLEIVTNNQLSVTGGED